MPTLHWIGKDKVINHHRDVPYKVLEHGYGFDAKKGKTKAPTGSGNMVIHGDNLEALKSLLPQYEGKVKCIYIDPPYNTGNEGWVYNDNVNDPRIKKWLGDVVGKEGEDLSRHDKWLCMMYPRLVLLHKLLADDGVIFVSIDDHEQHRLRLIFDELFGKNNYLNTYSWVNNLKGRQITGAGAAQTHEYVLSYAKSIRNVGLFELDVEKLKRVFPSSYKGFNYETEGDENGEYVVKNELYNTNSAFNEETRRNLVFNIHYNFSTNEVRFTDVNDSTVYDGYVKIPPKANNNGTHQYHAWRWGRDKIQRETDDLKFVEHKRGAKIFTKIRGFSKTIVKDIITDVTTKSGSDECKELFGATKVFDYPKPSSLVELLVEQMPGDSIVLDSFAGSGTTAHAVLNLNKQDGGDRKFILIEMMDYAETITAERVKRVMKGYGKDKKKTEGTGGAFDYYTLGMPLFNAQEQLNEEVGTERIREYIWYSETRSALQANTQEAGGKAAGGKGAAANPYYLGTHERTAFYFVYEKESLTTLDHDLLATLPTKGERTVIYADNCLLPKKFLEQHGIVFKKIPRDISRF